MIREYLIRLPQALFQRRPIVIYVLQALLVSGALVLAWLLRFDFSLPYRYVLVTSGLVLISVRLISLRTSGLNHGWWHFASVNDAITILKSVCIGSAVFCVINVYALRALA